MNRLIAAAAVASCAFLGAGGTAAAEQAPQPKQQPGPTCSDVLHIEVHGQHVVGDYVTGLGHGELAWPPSGGVVGKHVAANGGVAVAGGPGPGFHFVYGFAPGASFCTGSQSPGKHA